MRRTPIAIASASLLVPLVAVTGAGSVPPRPAPCESDTPPTYAGEVPTGEDVPSIGFPIGSEETTAAQIEDYLAAVDEASDDVRLGSFGTSQRGPAADVRRRGRTRRRRRGQDARPGSSATRATTPAEAAQIAAAARRSCGWPATCTAARRAAPTRPCVMLRDLADRTDCAATSHPRQHGHGDHPDPEPRRPRGRHPPQRLRLRPQPRLVRAHPGRDRRQARADAAVPARADERQPRDGRHRLLLPAERRPDPPRGRRPLRRAGSTTCTAAPCRTSSTRTAIPYFNYDVYDLLYMGYGDSVPTTGFLGRVA